MTTSKTTIAALAALMLLAVPTFTGEALAKVHIGATVRTPIGTVRWEHGPRINRAIDCYDRHGRGHRPYDRITKQDRRIARRLSRYTGFGKRELLRMRRHNHCWFDVGREIGLRRAAVRAAFRQESWKRFVRSRRGRDRCSVPVEIERPRRGCSRH